MKQPFTQSEQQVMDLLVQAHNLFLALPTTHTDEQRDWRDAFHRLQDLMGCRVLRRDYPDYFQAMPVAKQAIRPWDNLKDLPISEFTPAEESAYFAYKGQEKI